MDDLKWMKAAIESGKQNPSAPFGTVLVDMDSNEIVVRGVNQVRSNPVWHGEVVALNRYAELKRERWNRLCLYTTAEPCCMCQAAILWSRIPRVVFGTSVPTLVELGWNQFQLSATQVVEAASFAECEIVGGVGEQECDNLFRQVRR